MDDARMALGVIESMTQTHAVVASAWNEQIAVPIEELVALREDRDRAVLADGRRGRILPASHGGYYVMPDSGLLAGPFRRAR